MPDLMAVEAVLLQSTFPALRAGPSDFACPSGGQLRPTDRAMTARSVRTSPSDEESRSMDEEDRLLTKRYIERQWKNTSLEQNTCLRVKRLPCDDKSDGQS